MKELYQYYEELDALYDDEEFFYQKVSEDAMGNNNPNAFFVLGRLYLEGHIVRWDVGKALKYFKIAYELSDELDPFEAITFINKYRDEFTWTKELKESYMSLLEYLSERDAAVLVVIAEEYGMGELVNKDIQKEIELYEFAGERGESFAFACLGEMYYKGEEVEKDYQKAYDYLIKADDNKSTIKEFYLGEMYRLGIVVNQDTKEAAEYYKKITNDKAYIGDEYYELASLRLEELEKE